MAHDVFISHAASDKAIADAACATLEREGIRCWIAPRDVVPGDTWARAIIDAITGSRVMVLIFSPHTNSSGQVMREVERAVNKGIPILPLRLEDVAPTGNLEYFISASHWLDAMTPPLERHLERLADTVKVLIGAAVTGPLPTARRTGSNVNRIAAIETPAVVATIPVFSRPAFWIVAAILVAAVLWVVSRQTSIPPPSAAGSPTEAPGAQGGKGVG